MKMYDNSSRSENCILVHKIYLHNIHIHIFTQNIFYVDGIAITVYFQFVIIEIAGSFVSIRQ